MHFALLPCPDWNFQKFATAEFHKIFVKNFLAKLITVLQRQKQFKLNCQHFSHCDTFLTLNFAAKMQVGCKQWNSIEQWKFGSVVSKNFEVSCLSKMHSQMKNLNSGNKAQQKATMQQFFANECCLHCQDIAKVTLFEKCQRNLEELTCHDVSMISHCSTEQHHGCIHWLATTSDERCKQCFQPGVAHITRRLWWQLVIICKKSRQKGWGVWLMLCFLCFGGEEEGVCLVMPGDTWILPCHLKFRIRTRNLGSVFGIWKITTGSLEAWAINTPSDFLSWKRRRT